VDCPDWATDNRLLEFVFRSRQLGCGCREPKWLGWDEVVAVWDTLTPDKRDQLAAIRRTVTDPFCYHPTGPSFRL
jgi:hypothetical protein